MRFKSKRGIRETITLLWVLCTICTLFLRICFDSTQTDSSLAYSSFIWNSSTAIVDSDYVFDNVDAGESALCAAPKGVPAQQAYASESTCQGSSVLVPRKTVQRINPRGAFSNNSGILPEGIFADTFSFWQRALSSDGLCEIISNTVILQYIHRQDGEKA